MSESRFIRKGDAWVLLLLLLAGLALLIYFQSRPKASAAEIYVDNRLIASLPLDRDGDFRFNECPGIVFRVENGRVCFLHSDCPDQICVSSGWLSQSGACAVCLPHKTVLKLKAASEPDAVVKAVLKEVRL